MLIFSFFLTKIRGKIPAIAVITALKNRGEKEESKLYIIDTATLKNIKNALNINAIPIFLDTMLKFMTIPYRLRITQLPYP